MDRGQGDLNGWPRRKRKASYPFAAAHAGGEGVGSTKEATRRALEAMMKGYEYQSDFAKKYVALGRSQGRR